MKIRKGFVALVGAGLLATAGGTSFAIRDIGRISVNDDACRTNANVNNDDGIGGGRNRTRGGCNFRQSVRIRG
jgi:hypothetical protein